jgi:hypothetical protein
MCEGSFLGYFALGTDPGREFLKVFGILQLFDQGCGAVEISLVQNP